MNQWQKMDEILGEAALKLQNTGTDFVIITTSIMHKVTQIVQSKINIPLFHIIDALSVALRG